MAAKKPVGGPLNLQRMPKPIADEPTVEATPEPVHEPEPQATPNTTAASNFDINLASKQDIKQGGLPQSERSRLDAAIKTAKGHHGQVNTRLTPETLAAFIYRVGKNPKYSMASYVARLVSEHVAKFEPEALRIAEAELRVDTDDDGFEM